MEYSQSAEWWGSPAPTEDGRTNAELHLWELVEHYGGARKMWFSRRKTAKKQFGEVLHFPKLETGAAAFSGPPADEDEVKRTVRFMTKGRTTEELEAAGIDLSFAGEIEGYDLFETRNVAFERIFMLLPELTEDIALKKPIWTHRWAVDEDGQPQPYLMIQMPKRSWEKIKVVPIADVHFGANASLETKFREYVNWIAENDNVFCFINGDLFENSHGDSNRGVSHYEQGTRPRDQVDEMTKILAPIAHKVLWMHPGNHEDRSRVRDYDPMERLCERLSIPYSYEPVYVDILWMGHVFSFHAKHGNTSSQTKGGKLNAAMRPQKFQDFTMFTIMSHVHDSISTRNTRVCRDREHFRLVFRKQYVIITPSFYGYFGSYGSKAGYEPGSYGSVNADLFRNGDYHANA